MLNGLGDEPKIHKIMKALIKWKYFNEKVFELWTSYGDLPQNLSHYFSEVFILALKVFKIRCMDCTLFGKGSRITNAHTRTHTHSSVCSRCLQNRIRFSTWINLSEFFMPRARCVRSAVCLNGGSCLKFPRRGGGVIHIAPEPEWNWNGIAYFTCLALLLFNFRNVALEKLKGEGEGARERHVLL